MFPPTFGSEKPPKYKMTPKGPLKMSSGKLSSKSKVVPDEYTVKGTTPSGRPRVYVCHVCTRAFARQEHLKRHQRSHTKEKPFACSICSRKFSRRDLLLRHSTKLHAGAANSVQRVRKVKRRRNSMEQSALGEYPQSGGQSGQYVANPSGGLVSHDGLDSILNSSTVLSSLFNNQPMGMAGALGPMGPMGPIGPIGSLGPLGGVGGLPPAPATNVAQQVYEGGVFTGLPNPSEIPPPTSQFQFPTNHPLSARRASFSALGESYVASDPAPFAGDTVEFSTPQYQPDSESNEDWLNRMASNRRPSGSSASSRNTPALPQLVSPVGYSFYDETLPAQPPKSLWQQPTERSHALEVLRDATEKEVDPKDSQNPQNHENHENPQNPQNPQNPNPHETTNGRIEKVQEWQKTLFNQEITSLETIADLNVAKPYDLPVGYSFYGDADQVMDSLSSNATISPGLITNAEKDAATPKSAFPLHSNDLAIHDLFLSQQACKRYSRVNLFTPTIRSYVHQSLSLYPFLGVPVPSIPKNDTLNHYVQLFRTRFLTHLPFVHESQLNEYSLVLSTLSSVEPDIVKDDNFVCNIRVCFVSLPLLLAALGACYANRKEDASALYEASRRCIHVYLDTRKKLRRRTQTATSSASPLWLVQSLTLSVYYGLFADERTDLSVVMRQVNALASIVRSSGLNRVSFDVAAEGGGGPGTSQIYFDNFVRYESTVRTVHCVFHICTMLCSLYNIAPALHLADMQLDLPCSTLLWRCSSVHEFDKTLQNFEFHALGFQRALDALLDAQDLQHVSEFGLLCLQNGIHMSCYTRPKCSGKLYALYSMWDSLLDSLSVFDTAADPYVDSRTLNWFLGLRLNPAARLVKLKQCVWLRDYTGAKAEFSVWLKSACDEHSLCKAADDACHVLAQILSLSLPATDASIDLRGAVADVSARLGLPTQVVFDAFVVLSRVAWRVETLQDASDEVYATYLRVVRLVDLLERYLQRFFTWTRSPLDPQEVMGRDQYHVAARILAVGSALVGFFYDTCKFGIYHQLSDALGELVGGVTT